MSKTSLFCGWNEYNLQPFITLVVLRSAFLDFVCFFNFKVGREGSCVPLLAQQWYRSWEVWQSLNYILFFFASAYAYVALLVIWYISENSSIAVSTLYLYVLIIVNLMNSWLYKKSFTYLFHLHGCLFSIISLTVCCNFLIYSYFRSFSS